MANVSISSLILFIGSMALAAGVAGTLMTNVSQVSASIEERSIDLSRNIETEIDVISDAGSDAIYDDADGEITVLVKNTGSRSLPHDEGRIDVLVDGEYVSTSALDATVLDADTWGKGDVVELVVNETLANGDHRVVVIVEEDREVLRFHT